MNRRLFLAIGLTVLIAPAAFAGEYDTSKRDGVAIGGYDAVSYFGRAPEPGRDEFKTEWKGVTWLFSSAENRDQFQSTPEKFAPQYGGYCAFAAAKGSLAPADPEAWTIHDGKLYLNYNTSIREKWQSDIPGYIAKADANWPGIKPN